MTKNLLQLRNLSVILAGSIILTACGGGGSSGSPDPGSNPQGGAGDFSGNTAAAQINDDQQAATAAYAATEAVFQTIASEETSTTVPVAANIDQEPLIVALTSHIQERIEEHSAIYGLPLAITSTVEGDCGGSVTFNLPEGFGQTQEDGTYNADFTYNNYCTSFDGNQSILNGVLDYTFTYENGEIVSAVYDNDYTYTSEFNGQTIQNQITGTVTCTFGGDNGGVSSCSFSEDFVGPNGRTYRVENASVSEDGQGNYNVNARVFDDELGYVDFDATSIDSSCDNGNFAGGTINFTDAEGNEVTVEFRVDCITCEVTLNDNPTQFLSQPDRTSN